MADLAHLRMRLIEARPDPASNGQNFIVAVTPAMKWLVEGLIRLRREDAMRLYGSEDSADPVIENVKSEGGREVYVLTKDTCVRLVDTLGEVIQKSQQ